MGLTKKQKRAWNKYGEEEGDVSFAGIEEIPPEFGTPKSLIEKLKAVQITKRGGYEDIPEELIVEAAKKRGLEGNIPPVLVEEEVFVPSVSLRGRETVVVIPRRLNKGQVPQVLEHEFAHYGLGHLPDVEETYGEHFIKELQADRVVGPITTSPLIDRIFAAVDQMDLSWREAIDIIIYSAREIGVSEVVIRRAKKWVRNYIDRYALDLDEGKAW